ncbi:hypothetical protein [Actinomadura mexicana]|uniref:Uncharacterized protein n=1 Tax=Actinomadura mexicana TaxID=134959 RepID=A0A239A7W2_9ACTN|nr:hypothetical protein [Actinomadura mexicana]SNR91725.1 hypothetical protein SAMN06265355_108254 [Actinomadura mexicana]
MADKRDKWAQGKAHQSEANKAEGIEEESSDDYRSGPQDQQQGQQGQPGK